MKSPVKAATVNLNIRANKHDIRRYTVGNFLTMGGAMLNLQRMNMFVAVVDSGSFTAAAALPFRAVNRSCRKTFFLF